MQWIKIQQYSDIEGINRTTTWKRIKKGKLQAKEIGKFWCVLVSDDMAKQVSQRTKEKAVADMLSPSVCEIQSELQKLKNEIEYKRAKLQQIKADTELKKQKVKINREIMRRQFAVDCLDIFTDCFAELKNYIISLQFDKRQNDIFQKTIKECINTFGNGMRSYLKYCDEMENNEIPL